MPIIINVDVMLCKAKMQSQELARKNRHYTGQSFYPENRKSQGYKTFHSGSFMQSLDCQPGDLWNIQKTKINKYYYEKLLALAAYLFLSWNIYAQNQITLH